MYEYTEEEREALEAMTPEERNERYRIDNLFHHITGHHRRPAPPAPEEVRSHRTDNRPPLRSLKMNRFVRGKDSEK